MPDRLSLNDVRDLIEDRLRNEPGRFIRPEVHTPDQSDGDISKSRLFQNGPRRLNNLIAERDRIAREEAWRAYARSQAEEQERHARKLLEENQRREEEVRRRVAEEQRLEKERRAREVPQYSSEEERVFRQEAEQVHDRNLNEKLLRDWLAWKAEETKKAMVEIEQEAGLCEAKASENQYYANNVWDNINTYRKSGSDASANRLTDHWRELEQEATVYRKRAVLAHDDAGDAKTSHVFYDEMAGKELRLRDSAGRSLFLKVSFNKAVDRELAKLIRRAKGRRDRSRFYRSCWKWTKRGVIAFLIFILLSLLGWCSQLAKS
jgi:hypothetical protein